MNSFVCLMRRCGWLGFRSLAAALALVPVIGAGGAPASAEQAVFATPEAAVEAFRAAVYSDGGKGMIELFGPEHKADLLGGDPASARQGLQVLREIVARGINPTDDGRERKVLVIGPEAWPMPIPLIKGEKGWSFDVDAGIEEINDRRIGRNELVAIDFCRTFMEAQPEYASEDRDGDDVLEYAEKLKSSDGKRDGLYWPEDGGGDLSPLADLAADAEEYLAFREAGEPYRGYYFRVLTRQGENPPVGAYDYIINGHMIAGYALIAWPADYGRSGIMTFLCSHHGRVLDKDLGDDTAKAAESITAYNPDDSWADATD